MSFRCCASRRYKSACSHNTRSALRTYIDLALQRQHGFFCAHLSRAIQANTQAASMSQETQACRRETAKAAAEEGTFFTLFCQFLAQIAVFDCK